MKNVSVTCAVCGSPEIFECRSLSGDRDIPSARYNSGSGNLTVVVPRGNVTVPADEDSAGYVFSLHVQLLMVSGNVLSEIHVYVMFLCFDVPMFCFSW